MDDRIEAFLSELKGSLHEESAEEQERRIAEACSRLETFVASNLRRGDDEEQAVTRAIEQFHSGDVAPELTAALSLPVEPETSDVARPASRRLTLPPEVLCGLYCAVTYVKVTTLARYFLWFVAFGTLAPSEFTIRQPSFFLGVAALILLLRHEGLQRIVGNALDSGNRITSGVRWVVGMEGLICLIWTAVILIAKSMNGGALGFGVFDSDDTKHALIWLLATFTLSAPLISGLLVGKSSPGTAVVGVKVAATTAFLLTFADFFTQWLHNWPDPADCPIPFYVVILLMYAIFIGLFYALGVAGATIGAAKVKRAEP